MIKSHVRYSCLNSTVLRRFPHIMPDSEKQGFKSDFINAPAELVAPLFSKTSATKC